MKVGPPTFLSDKARQTNTENEQQTAAAATAAENGFPRAERVT